MKLPVIMAAPILALWLSACSSNPYFPNKSAADIPAKINSIHLADVEIVDSFRLKKNEDPPQETDPSKNDQEVLQVAKKAAIAQLTNFGYRVVETTTRPSEISANLYIVYQPELGPITGRLCQVNFRVTNAYGEGILDTFAAEANVIGIVGAILGPPRDEMVGRATQEAVVKAVTEMKKGTGAPPLAALQPYMGPSPSAQPQAMPAVQSPPAADIPLESQPSPGSQLPAAQQSMPEPEAPHEPQPGS